MNSNDNSSKYEMEFSNNWLITYSDMITILLCFFIIFFIYTSKELTNLSSENKDLKKENDSLAAQLFGLHKNGRDPKSTSEDFMTFLEKNNLQDQVDIIENERGLLIRFRDSVLFQSGQAGISPDGYLLLDQIGAQLQRVNNNIIVEGYTDNVPIRTKEYPSNWELSVARSIQVVKYLTENKGIAKNRVSVSGYGERNPIDSNSTPEGRANNRRIEIIIAN
ncbi:chemotaxis protein MotB [Anaerosolibacter carboniphilus]|uniref:Chemotaxis protein MotB n=1 Tax=Anaerosolibacter carboniphilus TaxID=1417629 RepID=A0A841KT45_9FIRM|nr:flagellar motor protein MotB [Anaerosolibacter carboniphilus]MBB6216884.1 chemotaxis protein MotB [Anaerosolibacter carboniphilus]